MTAKHEAAHALSLAVQAACAPLWHVKLDSDTHEAMENAIEALRDWPNAECVITPHETIEMIEPPIRSDVLNRCLDALASYVESECQS